MIDESIKTEPFKLRMATSPILTHIHPNAIIDSSAKIDEDVCIGPWTVIGPNVEIGAGTQIDSHVVINSNTKMGERNKIYTFASVGGDPQDLSYNGEQTHLEIGDDNIIREYVTISRGSVAGGGVTRIGNKNNFLAYAHVAHDCTIGNEVLFVNTATIAGHVKVDDYAILGAFTAVHQYCRIGSYSFITRSADITRDVLPYMLVTGPSEVPHGLNLVGLRRRGFSKKTMSALKRDCHIIYRRDLKLKEIRDELVEMSVDTPEIKLVLEVMDSSSRGIVR